ncbi:unnamed protein product [Rotaria sp. Silwood1]|nr:unnamed protein product [Rotaria sp. Silwood1]
MRLLPFLALILVSELVEVQADCCLLSCLGVPAGTIVQFGGTTLPPRWLWCNGQTVAIANYPTLCAAIGNNFGPTNATHCQLPNFQGKFSKGSDSIPSSSLGTGGLSTVTLGINNLPSHVHGVSAIIITGGTHTHTINDPGHDHGNLTYPANIADNQQDAPSGTAKRITAAQGSAAGHRHGIPPGFTNISVNPSGAHSHSVNGSTDAAGSANPDSITINPPYQSTNFIIFAGCSCPN